MKSRWTFRCYPTAEQIAHLNRTFGCVRFVWNWALRLRSDGHKNGERIGLPETDKQLTVLKHQPETVWLNEVSSICLQQSLRDLQLAFSGFFDKRTGYPQFKRKESRQSANYTENGFKFDPKKRTLKLAKLGALKVKWSRRVIPQPSSLRMIRTASGKYFVSFVVETPQVELPKTGTSIGIDFGINRLATLSNGDKIANPKYGAKWQKKLKFCQQRLKNKKDKKSKRRALAKIRIAKVYEKIANCRTDNLHKFSTTMVKRFDTIYIEDLNLRGMVKNHNLARVLSDASIGQAMRMLEEKANRYGKTVSKIDRWYPSSKTCSNCGYINKQMSLSVRDWVCPECKAIHDRDVNAAINIRAVGQTVTAHGDGVRVVRSTGRKTANRRSANQQRVKSSA